MAAKYKGQGRHYAAVPAAGRAAGRAAGAAQAGAKRLPRAARPYYFAAIKNT